MGERVEWVDMGAGWYRANHHGSFVHAYEHGGWAMYPSDGGISAVGTAPDLASAKLAAEAALRERGLLGPAPRTSDDDAAACASCGSYLGHHLACAKTPLACPPPTADEWREIDAEMREWAASFAAMRDASAAFAAIAAAMQTPQGRRVLAAQAVEEAVAEGARRGLDAEALRVVLCWVGEHDARLDAVDCVVRRNVARLLEGHDCETRRRYDRARAARSAKPLGRPPRRMGQRGREW